MSAYSTLLHDTVFKCSKVGAACSFPGCILTLLEYTALGLIKHYHLDENKPNRWFHIE